MPLYEYQCRSCGKSAEVRHGFKETFDGACPACGSTDMARVYSPAGIVWTAVTAVAMFLLAAGKSRTGRALDNPVLRTEGRVTLIDGLLAVAVLIGLVLNAAAGWWWADPIAGYVLVAYAAREVYTIFRS